MSSDSPEVYSALDARWMARALRRAEAATLDARPNPRVGCVLVDAQQNLLAEGATQAYGGAHAEVMALRAAGARAAGATAYVTLEPCQHQGQTGPCTEALIRAGIGRVVCAARDPNPRAAGGLEALQAAGIAVASGLFAESAVAINPGFHRRMAGGLPWVRLKMAITQDGFAALNDGRSQWITGPAARRDGHWWRARSCAVLTGSGTVLADKPRLTVRDWPVARQPLRVVVDRRGRVPAAAPIFAPELGPSLHLQGPQWGPRAVLAQLAERNCNEVLLEAGPTMAAAWWEAELVDELILYQNPSLLGTGQVALALSAPAELAARWRLQVRDRRQFGDDCRIMARPCR